MTWMTLFRKRLATKTKAPLLSRELDFVEPTSERWADFRGGDNIGAFFRVKGDIRVNDDFLVRLSSGRIGKYHAYSCRPSFEGVGIFSVMAYGLCYKEDYAPPVAVSQESYPKLVDCGARGPQPGHSSVFDLSSGFTRQSSEFWKVLPRNETARP